MACRPIFNTNINDRRDEDEFMPPVSRNHSLAPKALFPRQSLAPRCALPRPSLAPSRTGGLPTQQKLSLLPKYSLKPRQPTPQTAGKATPTGGGGCSTTNTRNNISSTKTSSGASGSSNSLGRQTVASQNKASSVRRSPLTYATGPPPFGRPTSANKGTNSAEKKRFPYSGTLPVDAMDPSLKMAEEKFVAALTQFGPALNMWKNATGGGGGTVTEGTQTEQQFAVIQSVLLAEDRFAAKRAAFEEACQTYNRFLTGEAQALIGMFHSANELDLFRDVSAAQTSQGSKENLHPQAQDDEKRTSDKFTQVYQYQLAKSPKSKSPINSNLSLIKVEAPISPILLTDQSDFSRHPCQSATRSASMTKIVEFVSPKPSVSNSGRYHQVPPIAFDADTTLTTFEQIEHGISSIRLDATTSSTSAADMTFNNKTSSHLFNLFERPKSPELLTDKRK